MRRTILLLTLALLVAALLALAGPATAGGGCKDFGQAVAENAPHKDAPGRAPLSDDIAGYHAELC